MRFPAKEDFEAWSDLRTVSRDHLEPWEPTWPTDDLTRGGFRRRLRAYQRDLREDTGYPFFVFQSTDHQLVGGCTLSNVRRGVSQAASLGYWMGKPYTGRGLMTAAVRCVVPFAFDVLGLHRLEAAVVPGNDASLHILRKCGFQEEGYARSYLKINGKWQDHILFAIVESDPRA